MCKCAQDALRTQVVISFKSYCFWVAIPCLSANYHYRLISAFIHYRHAVICGVCVAGRDPSGYDVLAPGAPAEEVGVLQQP